MRLEGWFDGVCEPRNPGGHAACGAVLMRGEERVFELGGYIGVGVAMSNNVAEYSGVIALLKAMREHPGDTLHIRGDSKLVIEQLSGRWRVNPGKLYTPFYERAAALLNEVGPDRVTFEWVPRDSNAICDDLPKSVLRARNIQFRIQPEEAA